ncbi:hypothetical protein CJU90_3079 [Yarrowia sp. C11]|nr:hypothetical protein CKK34_4528 [Yarrowia sp. E02]KAG5369607.1 hypothetical protein CJU90_3079 [Yarrowia sp. C11]
MSTNSPVEFTKSDDELLLYSYGLFSTGESDNKIDCIPWIAKKFTHHSLNEWILRFSELQRGLSLGELSERAEVISQKFDISDYVSELHKRGIEPQVDGSESVESRGTTVEPPAQVEAEKPSVPKDITSTIRRIISSDDVYPISSDDDDLFASRPVRPKRRSRPITHRPKLTEEEIQAHVKKQLELVGLDANHSRARQSRNYVERELGHVSLVHHQLSKLKAELTKKLNQFDRGSGYGGYKGQTPEVGFWGNDGSENGGAQDPAESETDVIMARFWDEYVSRKERDGGGLRGHKRSLVQVVDSDEEEGRPVKRIKNGTEKDNELSESDAVEVNTEKSEPDATERDTEKSSEPDVTEKDTEKQSQPDVAENVSEVIDVDKEDTVEDPKRDERLLSNLSREESLELESLLLAESDSDLSEPPSDIEESHDEQESQVESSQQREEDSPDVSQEVSFEEETLLKPVPKDFKIRPPHDVSESDEEVEDSQVDGDEEEEDSRVDGSEEEENSHIEESEEEDSEDEPEVTTTPSRRRSAGKPNYKEIPIDYDDSDNDKPAEDDSEEEEITPRTRRGRARVVSESSEAESSEGKSSDEDSEEETVSRRTSGRTRRLVAKKPASESESDYEDSTSRHRGRTRGKQPARRSSGRAKAISYVQEYDEDEDGEEEDGEEEDEDEDEDEDGENSEEEDGENSEEEDGEDDGDSEDVPDVSKRTERKPQSFTDLFHNRETNRVSLFSTSDSDSSDSDGNMEIVAVPKNKPKVVPRKRIGPLVSLATRGRARGRPDFKSSSEESSSSDLPELDDDSDDNLSESD